MIIIYQPKSLESPNIIDIESVTMEHPKTCHKLSKIISQCKVFSQVVGAGKNSIRPLYSETTKFGKFQTKKWKNNETISCL